MPVIRVAFVLEHFNTGWMGGLNYYINLIRAVHTMPNPRIEIVIFTGRDMDLHGLEEYAQVIRSGFLDKKAFSRNFRKVTQKVLRKDLILYWLARQNKIDCLSHFGSLWKDCSIPALTWIADFQHKRLPQFFDHAEIERRDNNDADSLQFGNAILLSSYSAAKDMRHYYPNASIDTHVLQFVSTAPDDWQPQAKHRLQKKYQLPENWFHVPNQFWAHKNHRVVIEALNILKCRGLTPIVVATGSTADFRNPDHFSSITKLVASDGLKDTFRTLGVIPYEDMLSLMYHSIAVINPSLFEGWSTTVEEAKSMGKKILLSDIDVHIEQSPKRANFFSPHESAQLANLMEQAINDIDQNEENRQIELAKQETIHRQQKFTRTYQEIIIKLMTKARQQG